MDRNQFTAQYVAAEAGLNAMEAAIGPRRRIFSNPGAMMIHAATGAVARTIASLICYDSGIDAAANEISRILLERDTMADWTAEERAALAYDSAARVAHKDMAA